MASRIKGMAERWRKCIPREDKVFSQSDWVCALHFKQEDIVTHWVNKGPDGKEIKIERQVPVLAVGAEPCIYPNLPSYLSKTTAKKRKPPKIRSPPVAVKKQRGCNYSERESQWENIEDEIRTPEIIQGLEPCEQSPSEDSTENSTNANYNVNSDARAVQLPLQMWASFVPDKETTLFCLIKKRLVHKCLEIGSDHKMEVFVRNVKVPLEAEIKERKDIEEILKTIDAMKVCCGAEPGKYSKSCTVVLSEADKSKVLPGPKKERCSECKQTRENLLKQRKREEERFKTLPKMTALAKRSQQRRRLLQKVQEVGDELQQLQKKYEEVEKKTLDEFIKNLPLKQKEMVKTCIAAGKAKSPTGHRYSIDWVHECILMRIKGPRLYRKLMRDKLLPLPHPRTLSRYIKKLAPVYGFDPNVFEMMKGKVESMSPAERRGSLLIDEMKLSEAVSFNKTSLQVEGLVDLGQFTPENQKQTMGDHALVLMFQPFRGPWVQAVGAFLSRGAAPGKILEKIVLEGVLLLEKAGLYVDEVVTDGGSWNRAMWKLFGVSKKSCSCVHPTNEKRRLWFSSDFPHLMKTMWSRVRIKKGSP